MDHQARAPRARLPARRSLDIRRVRRGKGFVYQTTHSRPVAHAAQRRIAALAIPPAWTDVEISSAPNQPLQATGYDQRGRKQYLYHRAFRAHRDRRKFASLRGFAASLPQIRRAIARGLRGGVHQRETVLAAVVWLLDQAHLRVGGDEYCKANQSFGLTTLLNRHAAVKGERIQLDFRGKSRVRHQVEVRHRQVAKIVAASRRLRSRDLLAYVDESGKVRDVTARLVNEHLRTIADHPVSAKDFRTWGANVVAFAQLCRLPPPATKTEAKRIIAGVVRQVATRLNNTPAVCRKSYLHPELLQAFSEGSLGRPARTAQQGGQMTRAEREFTAWLAKS